MKLLQIIAMPHGANAMRLTAGLSSLKYLTQACKRIMMAADLRFYMESNTDIDRFDIRGMWTPKRVKSFNLGIVYSWSKKLTGRCRLLFGISAIRLVTYPILR